MVLKEIWWEDLDWMHVAQDGDWLQALRNVLMNIWVLLNVENFLTS
jgi:hypothetical protein